MSASAAWVAVETYGDLHQLHQLLTELGGALEHERAAVARLDAAALTAAAEAKQRIVAAIQRLGDPATAPPPSGRPVAAEPRLRDEVRILAARVRASALANSALLTDALRAASDALGLGGDESATYDRRARRVTGRGGYGLRSL